jgi:hypothetical protein
MIQEVVDVVFAIFVRRFGASCAVPIAKTRVGREEAWLGAAGALVATALAASLLLAVRTDDGYAGAAVHAVCASGLDNGTVAAMIKSAWRCWLPRVLAGYHMPCASPACPLTGHSMLVTAGVYRRKKPVLRAGDQNSARGHRPSPDCILAATQNKRNVPTAVHGELTREGARSVRRLPDLIIDRWAGRHACSFSHSTCLPSFSGSRFGTDDASYGWE